MLYKTVLLEGGTKFDYFLCYSCLIGFLYDYTQTYDCSFYLAGLCYLLSSVSLFMEPLAQRWKARRKQDQAKRAENSCKTNGCFTPDRLQNGAV